MSIFNSFRSGGGQIAHTQGAENQQEQMNGQQSQNGQAGPEEQEEESTFAPLVDIFGNEAEEEDESIDDDEEEESRRGQGRQQQPGQQQQQAPGVEHQLAREIQTMLSGMNIGEDAIPEGFDPADPKQFRDVVGKIQQQTALATMQMAFKPMEAAMKQFGSEIRNEIKSMIQESTGGQQARQTLETLVPEAKNPELKGLVDTLFESARKKSKNPTEAAQKVRKALDAMNIKSDSKRGSGHSDPSEGSAFKEGKAALDMFAPLPSSNRG